MNASELLKKYREGKCTPEELALLETWYLEQKIQQKEQLKAEERIKAITEIQDYLNAHISTSKSGKIKWWHSAAAIFLVTMGAYWWTVSTWKSPDTSKQNSELAMESTLAPDKAYLTLADGTKIALTDEKDGLLAKQKGVKISKMANGQLVYETDSFDSMNQTNTTFNIISTPKGAQFAVKLPDGTQVWLNANSSLRYPVHFSGNKRHVELTGEAYFDVTKHSSMPFEVSVERQDGSQFLVQVLGTQFNINAYSDEKIIKTTLIEGKVQTSLSDRSDKVSLKPGEQLLLKNRQMNVLTVNPADEIAWKEGNFAFKNTEIHEVMRQLARWYNISVNYKGSSHEETFTGYIARDVSLKDVLDMLEKGGGVKFKIIGKEVEVFILNE